MDRFLKTLKEFFQVAFIVVLWAAIVLSFIGGLDEMNRGGGGLAGAALLSATLLYLFGGSKKRVGKDT